MYFYRLRYIENMVTRSKKYKDFAELPQDQQIAMEEYRATGSLDSAVTLPILETGQVTTSTSCTETVTLPNANSRFLAKFELFLTEE